MIKIENLSLKYDDVNILENINITINNYGLYILTGRSGIGKTSLLNAILGFNSSYNGNIYFNNIFIKNKSEYEIFYRNNIYYASQDDYFIEELSLNENFKLFTSNVELNNLDKYIKKYNLTPLFKKKTRELSLGEKQRSLIALMMAKRKKINVLDEILSNLDEKYLSLAIEDLKDLANEAIIIIVSHLIDKFENVSYKELLLKDNYSYIEEPNQIEVNNTFTKYNKFSVKLNLKSNITLVLLVVIICLLLSLSLLFTNSNLNSNTNIAKNILNENPLISNHYIDIEGNSYLAYKINIREISNKNTYDYVIVSDEFKANGKTYTLKNTDAICSSVYYEKNYNTITINKDSLQNLSYMKTTLTLNYIDIIDVGEYDIKYYDVYELSYVIINTKLFNYYTQNNTITFPNQKNYKYIVNKSSYLDNSNLYYTKWDNYNVFLFNDDSTSINDIVLNDNEVILSPMDIYELYFDFIKNESSLVDTTAYKDYIIDICTRSYFDSNEQAYTNLLNKLKKLVGLEFNYPLKYNDEVISCNVKIKGIHLYKDTSHNTSAYVENLGYFVDLLSFCHISETIVSDDLYDYYKDYSINLCENYFEAFSFIKLDASNIDALSNILVNEESYNDLQMLNNFYNEYNYQVSLKKLCNILGIAPFILIVILALYLYYINVFINNNYNLLKSKGVLDKEINKSKYLRYYLLPYICIILISLALFIIVKQFIFTAYSYKYLSVIVVILIPLVYLAYRVVGKINDKNRKNIKKI